MFTRTSAALIVAAAGLVSAQSLSSQCQNALTAIVANPDANSCLNPTALVSIAADENTSIVDPISNWVSGVCGVAPCTNETLASVVTNITAGCQSELSLLGYESSQNSVITSYVQMGYATAREVLCLKDGSDYCVSQTLKNVQDMYGTLSVNGITSIISRIGASDNFTVPTNITCSNCSKAAYNTIKSAYPSLVDGLDTSTCGASFADGSNPSGISFSASTASPGSNNNGALAGSVPQGALFGVAFTVVAAVASGLTIFA